MLNLQKNIKNEHHHVFFPFVTFAAHTFDKEDQSVVPIGKVKGEKNIVWLKIHKVQRKSVIFLFCFLRYVFSMMDLFCRSSNFPRDMNIINLQRYVDFYVLNVCYVTSIILNAHHQTTSFIEKKKCFQRDM